MLTRIVLCGAVAACGFTSPLSAQTTPERAAELTRQHQAISPKVNQIITQKVSPVFADLSSPNAPLIEAADLSTLRDSIELASSIQQELSSESTFRGVPVKEPLRVRYECRRVRRWVRYLDSCGRCYWYCRSSWEWVKVPLKKPKEYGVAERQPLRDAIDKMEIYLNNRLGGRLPADPQKDRIAALQTYSILQIVDPIYTPGEAAR